MPMCVYVCIYFIYVKCLSSTRSCVCVCGRFVLHAYHTYLCASLTTNMTFSSKCKRRKHRKYTTNLTWFFLFYTPLLTCWFCNYARLFLFLLFAVLYPKFFRSHLNKKDTFEMIIHSFTCWCIKMHIPASWETCTNKLIASIYFI